MPPLLHSADEDSDPPGTQWLKRNRQQLSPLMKRAALVVPMMGSRQWTIAPSGDGYSVWESPPFTDQWLNTGEKVHPDETGALEEMQRLQRLWGGTAP